MYKVLVLVALAIVGARAQNGAAGENAAPEPYSYGYQTDTHSAAEQRDPNGRVTGFYNIVDVDGRQRRVEYIADEGGFRAKVQTNEVGTKSENSADVEVLASPPNNEQLVYQPQRVATQQAVAPQSAGYSYVQQPSYNGYGYGYYPGYGYGMDNRYGYYGAGNSPYGYGYGYGYNQAGVYGGYNQPGAYGSYNNHLPSSYYRSLNGAQPTVFGVSSSGIVGRSASVPATANTGTYRNYQTVGVPSSAGYQTVGVAPSSVGYSTGSSLSGSSNYIVLKKRASETAEKPKST